MSLNNIIRDWVATPIKDLETDIGILMDKVKANSTLRVYTFYDENDMQKFRLILVSKTNPRKHQYMFTTRANKIFPINFFI